MKYYIIHGTTDKNLANILKSGYLEADIDKKNEGVLSESDKVNQIFTQLLYRGLPNQKYQIPYWFNCCIVLDKQILKDYPFYATHIGHFYKNFLDAFSKDAKYILAKSKGKLDKEPDLKILKEHIRKEMKGGFASNATSPTFMHSNEILFNKKISLKKYCKYILYARSGGKGIYSKIIPKNLLLLASKLNIPIKYYNSLGLNNLIDFIEK